MSTTAKKKAAKGRKDQKDQPGAPAFVASAAALADAVGVVCSVVPRKSTLCEQVSMVLVEWGPRSVALTGSDGESRVTVPVSGATAHGRSGLVLVPAAALKAATKELKTEDEVEVEVDERHNVVLSVDGVRVSLAGMDAQDYPAMATGDKAAEVTVSAERLAVMLEAVSYAAHDKVTRYAMHGVCLEVGGGELRLVATDGKRLSTAWAPLPGESESRCAILPVPAARLVEQLARACDPDDLAAVELGQNGAGQLASASFRLGDAAVCCRLLVGHYPPYRDVLPKDHKTSAKFDRAELVRGLRRASLLASKDSLAVRCKFTGDKSGELVMTARVPETGEVTVTVPCEVEGLDVEAGFNPGYWLDLLKVWPEDEVTLLLQSGWAAAYVTCEGGDVSRLALVMPLALG